MVVAPRNTSINERAKSSLYGPFQTSDPVCGIVRNLGETSTGGFSPDQLRRNGNYQPSSASSPRESKLGTRRPVVTSKRLVMKFSFSPFCLREIKRGVPWLCNWTNP